MIRFVILGLRRARAAWPLAFAVAVGCRAERRVAEMRLWTDDFAIRVSMEPTPPVAREPVAYRVVVRDKATGQPIDGGERARRVARHAMIAGRAWRCVPSLS